MLVLVLGLVVFLGAHLFTRARDRRAAMIAAFGGEGTYKLVYSLASAVGLVLIVVGWRLSPVVDVWSPPSWTRHVPEALMWPAFVLLFASHLPGHIKAKAKHPMLLAVKIWATAHLIANGDLASIILFGSFLAWAVVARILIKRAERREGAAPVVPPASWRNDVIALIIGTVSYGLFGALLHPLLIGVRAFGM